MIHATLMDLLTAKPQDLVPFMPGATLRAQLASGKWTKPFICKRFEFWGQYEDVFTFCTRHGNPYIPCYLSTLRTGWFSVVALRSYRPSKFGWLWPPGSWAVDKADRECLVVGTSWTNYIVSPRSVSGSVLRSDVSPWEMRPLPLPPLTLLEWSKADGVSRLLIGSEIDFGRDERGDTNPFTRNET